MENSLNLKEVLSKLNKCLEEVAEFQLLSLESQEFQIEEKKTEFDMVTEIDKKSEEMIMSFIRENYPGHSILTEETGFHDGKVENEY